MPDKLGKDGQGVLPRPRDIMMQINFKVMKRSNIRVKQITISQDLTVHCHSTSLEPYNFIKNIWSKISKFQNSSIRAFEPRENSQKFSKALFSSSKLAFWCFENALNSWLLLKMNFWCKKLWFYVSEFALIWWPHIHFLFVLMGPLKSECPFPVFWTRWNGNASLSDWFHMHTFISSLPVPKFETQIHKTQDCILNAVRIS